MSRLRAGAPQGAEHKERKLGKQREVQCPLLLSFVFFAFFGGGGGRVGGWAKGSMTVRGVGFRGLVRV